MNQELKRAIEESKKSIREICESIDISRQTLYQAINGNEVSECTADKINDYFRVQVVKANTDITVRPNPDTALTQDKEIEAINQRLDKAAKAYKDFQFQLTELDRRLIAIEKLIRDSIA